MINKKIINKASKTVERLKNYHHKFLNLKNCLIVLFHYFDKKVIKLNLFGFLDFWVTCGFFCYRLFSEPTVLEPLNMAAARALSLFGKVKSVFTKSKQINPLRICRYASIKAQSLVYDEFGDPGKVLK